MRRQQVTSLPKAVDSKGRISLGREFANHLVLVRQVADGVLEIVKATAVPDPELWLHQNPKAIRMVMEGLEQAKSGNLVEGPDMDEMAKLAKEMGD
jgi:hypothetical protein